MRSCSGISLSPSFPDIQHQCNLVFQNTFYALELRREDLTPNVSIEMREILGSGPASFQIQRTFQQL